MIKFDCLRFDSFLASEVVSRDTMPGGTRLASLLGTSCDMAGFLLEGLSSGDSQGLRLDVVGMGGRKKKESVFVKV